MDDMTARVTFSIASTESPGRVRELVEMYVNEACSRLEAEGLELTYRLTVSAD